MSRTPQPEDLANLLQEIQDLRKALLDTLRPADQVILDDVGLRNYLEVSKRTTAYWRVKGLITFSKLGGKIYYRLSDILQFVKRNEVPSVESKINIDL